MLDSLRKQQKVIVYVVAVTFILGLAGGGLFTLLSPDPLKGPVGKVNGARITRAMFVEQVQQLTARMQENNQNIDDNLRARINEQAWNNLVDEALLKQQISKNKIRVSKAEIRKAMETEYSVIPDLTTAPAFQTNGKFDVNKYYDYLNKDEDFRTQIFQIMKEYLPRKKLQDKIVAQGKINADSLKAEFVKDNDKMSGKAIWFDFNNADSVFVSEAEIQKYYDTNKDKEFKKGPASRLKYVSYDLLKLEADELYDQLIKNRNNKAFFESMARQKSKDPGSGKNGGSLGEFGKGLMVPEFEEAAFALKPGEISKPVQSQFGWHIIRCDRIVSSAADSMKIEASHILLSGKPSEVTVTKYRKEAQEARKLIARKGIDEAAKELKLEVTTSVWLAHDNRKMEGFGEHGGLYQFMTKSKAGKISDVFFITAGDQNKLVVAQILDNKKEYYEDFATKKLQIKFDLEKQKKVANVKAKADEFIKRVPKENYLTAAAAEGWKIIDLAGHKNKSYIPTVNAMLDDFSKAALALEEGQYSGLVVTKEGPFIIYAEKREKPDMKAFNKEKQEEIRKRLEDAAYRRWFEQVRKDAKIVDNRYVHGF